MGVEYKVIEEYGTIAVIGGIELRFNLVSWNGNEAKYDIRGWNKNTPLKGMVFTKDQIKNLGKIISGIDIKVEEKTEETVVTEEKTSEETVEKPKKKRGRPKKVVIETTEKETEITDKKEEQKEDVKSNPEIVNSLCQLPATDGNYISALNKATPSELETALAVMRMNKDGNKMRIVVCESRLKRLAKNQTQTTTKKETKVTKIADAKPKKKEFVLPDESKKCKIIKLAPSEKHYTLEDAKAKVAKEKEVFKEYDSGYVLDKLLELCEENQEFLDNFMREDKTYAKCFEYFYNMAKNGYSIKYGNIGYLDNNLAVGLAIDYYNADDEKMEKERKEKEEKEKAEREKKAKESKKTRKKEA